LFGFFKNRKRVITDRTGQIPYLIRWYVFLKDRKDFPFNITLHKVLVSDEPTLHDHPWNWGAFIIKGGYWEHIPVYNETTGGVVGSTRVWRGPGSIRFRKADDLHWLELEKDENGNEIPCWSLFFMGKKRKEWGFVDFVKHQGYRWIHNEKYLKEKFNG
jgi:hypothetical protein|tara:strand:- start:2501 stop:2977 length:477 start_codon:yes stop_codon:yes gene_type:complete